MRIPASVGVGLGVGAVALVALAGVGFLVYRSREKFDPTSDKNLAYTSVSKVGAAITGDKDFTLGTWLYNITHPGENDEIAKPVALRSARPPSTVQVDDEFSRRMAEQSPFIL